MISIPYLLPIQRLDSMPRIYLLCAKKNECQNVFLFSLSNMDFGNILLSLLSNSLNPHFHFNFVENDYLHISQIHEFATKLCLKRDVNENNIKSSLVVLETNPDCFFFLTQIYIFLSEAWHFAKQSFSLVYFVPFFVKLIWPWLRKSLQWFVWRFKGDCPAGRIVAYKLFLPQG